MTGSDRLPSQATTALVNLTVTQPATVGWATVYPCDQPRPLASNINFAAGQTVANSALARLSPSGTICIYNSAAAHLIVDRRGWL